jgi:succinoglycan biosynthesis protein ExoO
VGYLPARNKLNVAVRNCADIVCDNLHFIQDGALQPYDDYFSSRAKHLGQIDAEVLVDPIKIIRDDYGFLKPFIRLNSLKIRCIHYQEELRFKEYPIGGFTLVRHPSLFIDVHRELKRRTLRLKLFSAIRD